MPVTRLGSNLQPEEWAQKVLVLLRNSETQRLQVELKTVNDLATEY